MTARTKKPCRIRVHLDDGMVLVDHTDLVWEPSAYGSVHTWCRTGFYLHEKTGRYYPICRVKFFDVVRMDSL